MGFRALRLTGTLHTVGIDHVAVDSEYELTFHNDRDDGTLRSIYIGKLNGLPVNYVLALNYHSLALLIHQAGGFKAAQVPPRWVVRDIQQWPGDVLANPPENARFTLESEGGWEGWRTGPRRSVTCASGTNYPANQVHERIPGQAIDLDCVETNESGLSVRKLRYAFLRQLGVALIVEHDAQGQDDDGHRYAADGVIAGPDAARNRDNPADDAHFAPDLSSQWCVRPGRAARPDHARSRVRRPGHGGRGLQPQRSGPRLSAGRSALLSVDRRLWRYRVPLRLGHGGSPPCSWTASAGRTARRMAARCG
ncbi:hypothetical protein WJ972_26270 [Achromobacter insuavis]